MRLISFGTAGWKAQVGEGFTLENVARLAEGAGIYWSQLCPGAVVYVGYDTRKDAEIYGQVAGEVLATYGLNVKISDQPCPTPALGFSIANDTRAIGGLMITASGSYAAYQGACLRNNRGSALSIGALEQIEDLIPLTTPKVRGTAEPTDLLTSYLADLESYVDTQAIKDAHLSVVIDPMYGTARGILAHMLRELGCEVTEIHNDQVDDFAGIHPKPVEPWADECEQAVIANKAAAGFMVDGDGDRVGAVDETGELLDPNEVDALIAYHLIVNKEQSGRILMPISSSSYVKEVAEKYDVPVAITPIGFGWATNEMQSDDVMFACDARGGIAIPSHLYERDGLLTTLLLVEAMALSGKSLKELVAGLRENTGTRYYGEKEVPVDVAQSQMIKNLLPGLRIDRLCDMPVAQISHADGVRLEFDDGSWVLMRSARKNPSVKIYAEAPTCNERDELIKACSDLIRSGQIFGG